MAHEIGDRMHCDECGAEIVYVRPCSCPEDEPTIHQNLCCGQPMRPVREAALERERPPALE